MCSSSACAPVELLLHKYPCSCTSVLLYFSYSMQEAQPSNNHNKGHDPVIRTRTIGRTNTVSVSHPDDLYTMERKRQPTRRFCTFEFTDKRQGGDNNQVTMPRISWLSFTENLTSLTLPPDGHTDRTGADRLLDVRLLLFPLLRCLRRCRGRRG